MPSAASSWLTVLIVSDAIYRRCDGWRLPVSIPSPNVTLTFFWTLNELRPNQYAAKSTIWALEFDMPGRQRVAFNTIDFNVKCANRGVIRPRVILVQYHFCQNYPLVCLYRGSALRYGVPSAFCALALIMASLFCRVKADVRHSNPSISVFSELFSGLLILSPPGLTG